MKYIKNTLDSGKVIYSIALDTYEEELIRKLDITLEYYTNNPIVNTDSCLNCKFKCKDVHDNPCANCKSFSEWIKI